MSSIISHRVTNLEPSQSLVMAQRFQEMRQKGVDVVSFTLGEPDFATPNHIKDAICKAVHSDYSHYGPVAGLQSVRETISRYLLKEKHIAYAPNELILSVGAKQSICNSILALVNSGDEVIIPTPCWVSYSEMVKLAEGTPVFVKTCAETGYKLQAGELEDAITDRTKLLILCSPNNPTGSIYSASELGELVRVLERHPNMFVISDEVYAEINYIGGAPSLTEFASIQGRLIYIDSASKTYAMPGYRIGWMASKNKELIDACLTLQGQYNTCACLVSQKAAETACGGKQDCVELMRKGFTKRRELMCELASDIPNIRFAKPDGAFYLFPDVSAYYGDAIHNSDDMANYLLETAHVAVMAGSAYGEDNCIRISFSMPEDIIKKGMQRIKDALMRLKK
ncbi:MAG: pyridoxal phosphate-dependent aminotransferase [Paludibacteraceae bacterium]|nr:pyridoxal phosphate-dependent aminotransferase [Paludibacteraceae bacterium]